MLNKKERPNLVSMILLFLCHYGLISHNVWNVDEYIYAQNLNGEPLRCLSEIFEFQVDQYFTHSGRVIVHSIVQWFLGFGGDTLFHIVSSFIFVAFIAMLSKLCGRKYPVYQMMPIVLMLLVLFHYNFGLVFCGLMAYVINYLWTAQFFLIYICLFEKAKNQSVDCKPLNLIGFAVYAMLFGALQESFSIAACAGTFFYLVLNHKKWNSEVWALMIGLIIGSSFIVLAPGNFNRLGAGSPMSFFVSFGIKFTSVIPKLWPVFLFVITLFLPFEKIKEHRLSICKDNVFYITAMFASIIFANVVAYTGFWQMTSAVICLVILWVRLFNVIYPEISDLKRISIVTCCLLGVGYIPVWHKCKKLYDEEQRMIANVLRHDILSTGNYPYSQLRFEVTRTHCPFFDGMYGVNRGPDPHHMSVHLTDGKNKDFCTVEILPESMEKIESMCCPENRVEGEVYKVPEQLYYVIRWKEGETAPNILFEHEFFFARKILNLLQGNQPYDKGWGGIRTDQVIEYKFNGWTYNICPIHSNTPVLAARIISK